MSPPPDLWTAAAVVLSAPVGVGLARASVRLPQDAPLLGGGPLATGRRRTLAGVGAAIGLAAWAGFAEPGPFALTTALLGWMLLLLAWLDAEHLWLPRILTWSLAGLGFADGVLHGLPTLADRAIGFAGGFGFLWLIASAFRRVRGREGLGGGDAWLLAAGGAWLGWRDLPLVLIVASLSGLVVALLPALRGRRLDPHHPLPFGLFLAIGIWLVKLCAA